MTISTFASGAGVSQGVTDQYRPGFCNIGPTVGDGEARAMDRRRARQIGLGALGIGVVVGIVAVLLPV